MLIAFVFCYTRTHAIQSYQLQRRPKFWKKLSRALERVEFAPKTGHKTIIFRCIHTRAFLLLTVQSWAIEPPSLLANGAKQLFAGSNSGLTDKSREEARFIREFTDPTHYLALQTAVPMQGGNGNCLSQEQRTRNRACPDFSVYTPLYLKKHRLGQVLNTQRNSKHQNLFEFVGFLKPSSNGSLPTTAHAASAQKTKEKP